LSLGAVSASLRIDHKASAEQIEHTATLIPDEWLEPIVTAYRG
jgi:hypothetical protein